jgi:hypothetical protein
MPAGQLLAETEANQPFAAPSQLTLFVSRDGPFPYRILYLHATAIPTPGLSLRWSRPSATPATGTAGGSPAATGDTAGMSLYQNIAEGRLFTDAKMERNLLLAGSIGGTPSATLVLRCSLFWGLLP